MVMNEAQAAALQRAQAVIAKADATLAQPRPSGPLWEGKAAEPQPAPGNQAPSVGTMEAIAHQKARTPMEAIAHQTTRKAVKAVGTVLRNELAERDARLAELEHRLAEVEALLARARGATQ